MANCDDRVVGYLILMLTIAFSGVLDDMNVLAFDDFNQSENISDFSPMPLVTTQAIKNSELPVSLTRKEILSDLSYLQQRLEIQSSYLQLHKIDYKKALDQLRNSIQGDANALLFARSLQKIIMQIGDSHAEVMVSMDAENDRYLPFIVADSMDGFIAIKGDRSGFLEQDYPVIKLIDGKPIEHWLNIASRYVSRASPQFVRHASLRELRSIDRVRMEDGNARTPFIDITLQSLNGAKLIERRLKTSEKRLSSGKVVLGDSRILAGNIGYMRIRSMDSSNLEMVKADMTAFRHTEGLIIDVRDNRGGYYEILRALYGYFVTDSAPPYVTNITAYRLSPKFDEDYLHYRSTYRMTYPGWTAAERNSIENTIVGFEPEWQPPEGKFSTWHFMVLSRSRDVRQYHYKKPVAVLSNAASFSATDGFLSAFSDLPGVTIFGQPSGGGSGATRYFTLPNSKIKVLLSTMVSFRPNGKLFDSNGVEVDIPVMPAPDDFLGHSDAVLDRAIEWIRQTKEQTQLKQSYSKLYWPAISLNSVRQVARIESYLPN